MKIFTLLTSILVASCHHVYYAPNTPNAPLLSQKGDTRINALYSAGSDSDFEGGELQFGLAVSGKVRIMINGFFGGVTENTGSRDEKGNGTYVELGAGRFAALDEKRRWIGELYGGLGFGSVKNDYGLGDHSQVNIFKPFIQPIVGYKSKYFELAIVPRLSLVTWMVKKNFIGSQENESAKNDLDYISGKPRFFAFEPAFLMRGGGEDVKLQASLSFSRFRSTNVLYSPELTETLNASIGISVNFNATARTVRKN